MLPHAVIGYQLSLRKRKFDQWRYERSKRQYLEAKRRVEHP